jgi:transcriptional regulator with XRE-family HTH domain
MEAESKTENLANLADFANFIRERRKTLKLSQSELAGLCGMTTEGLSKIERGDAEPKLGTVLRLVKLLNGHVQLDWR